MSEENAKTVYETFNRVYSTGEPTKVFGWELLRGRMGKKGMLRPLCPSSVMRKGVRLFSGASPVMLTQKKALEKAKERIINHLSHELGTPLSLIEGAFVRILRAIEKADLNKIRNSVQRAQRNVSRLKALQEEIDDILNERPMQERERILHLIEAALGLMEEFEESSPFEGGCQNDPAKSSETARVPVHEGGDQTRVHPTRYPSGRSVR